MNDTKKNGSSRQQNKNRKQIQYTTILKCAAIFFLSPKERKFRIAKSIVKQRKWKENYFFEMRNDLYIMKFSWVVRDGAGNWKSEHKINREVELRETDSLGTVRTQSESW